MAWIARLWRGAVAPGTASLGLVAALVILAAACGDAEAAEPQPQTQPLSIGDKPAFTDRTAQEDINAGLIPLDELIRRGKELFIAPFNTLDGAGRPQSTGAAEVGVNNFRQVRVFPDNFHRISGPDGNTCASCHIFPRIGGAMDNAANVFTLAEKYDFLTFDGGPGDNFEADLTLAMVANERNPLALFGVGFVEMLAREMTADMHVIRDAAIIEARASGQPVTKELVTKDVFFGHITARPDGTLDTSRVEGVDADLIIKPFQQKGIVVSLREFMVKATNLHFGMQATERFGEGVDADGDGVINELTRGDITVGTVFLATLPPPGRVLPTDFRVMEAVEHGEALFSDIGCAVCHRTSLKLNNPVFSEPNPYNPPGKLQLSDVTRALTFDLTEAGPGPHLPKEADGSVLVPLFSDLKRHAMGEALNTDKLIHNGVPTDVFITRKLWGVASEPPFLHNGRATLLSEAILLHGGDAQQARDAFVALSQYDRDSIVEFIKTLQILPEEAMELVVYADRDGTIQLFQGLLDAPRAGDGARISDAGSNGVLRSVVGGVVGGAALLVIAGIGYGLIQKRRST